MNDLILNNGKETLELKISGTAGLVDDNDNGDGSDGDDYWLIAYEKRIIGDKSIIGNNVGITYTDIQYLLLQLLKIGFDEIDDFYFKSLEWNLCIGVNDKDDPGKVVIDFKPDHIEKGSDKCFFDRSGHLNIDPFKIPFDYKILRELELFCIKVLSDFPQRTEEDIQETKKC
jgi:hypothetical protein